MKSSEVRNLSREEMARKLNDLKEELFNLRFRQEAGQLENPKKIQAIRKDIARIKTVVAEIQSKEKTANV